MAVSLTSGVYTVTFQGTLAGANQNQMTVSSALTGTGANVTVATVQNGGTATIDGNLTNSGTVNPGGTNAAGNLDITGNYTQTSTGILNIELGGATAGSQYDEVAATGSATLGGTINGGLINSYNPLFGVSFTPVIAASDSGLFNFIYAHLSNGLSLVPSYGSTSMSLVNAPAGTTIAWANANGGAWNVPSNWNTNTLPVNGSVVYIGLGGSTFTVSLSTSSTSSSPAAAAALYRQRRDCRSIPKQ